MAKDANKNETPEPDAPATAPKDKAADFVRIAARRMDNALTAIRLLEPLSNKANYTYTPEQVAQIEGALVAAVRKVHDVFTGTVKASGGGFQFTASQPSEGAKE